MHSVETDRSFTADVAQVYDQVLVPLIFESYARDLAGRVTALQPASVLELACGTGALTRSLAQHLPESCAITAVDLNPAMVDFAARRGTVGSVTWARADVAALPFADGSFSVAVCQFSTMFFPDRVAAYQEVRRVLRPKGPFLFSVWRHIADNEFADVVTRALADLYPDDPPRFMARTPHGHGDPARIEAELRSAGWHDVAIERRDDVSAAAGPDIAAIAYCLGTPLRNEILARDPDGLAPAVDAATEAIRARFGSGRVTARISAVTVHAR